MCMREDALGSWCIITIWACIDHLLRIRDGAKVCAVRWEVADDLGGEVPPEFPPEFSPK